MKLTVPLLLITLTFISCRSNTIEDDTTIPVIGKNPEGEVTVDHVPRIYLQKKFVALSEQIQFETIGVLEQHVSKTPWDLSRITVGLKLQSEIEVLEIFEVEGEAHIEFRFQKKS